MARIARTPQRPVQAQNMMPPNPRRRLVQRPVRRLRVPRLAVDRLLLRVAVAFRAGELAQQPHLKTPAGKVLMSLLAATRVTMRTAKRIVVNAGLLPTTLPVVGGAAVALVAPAVASVVPVVRVDPVVPAVGAAICLGTSTKSIGK